MPLFHNFLPLVFLAMLFKDSLNRVHIAGPMSLRKYDQAEILEEEDRRDILRDTKTIYAPDYRMYGNGSLCTFVNKEKRDVDIFGVVTLDVVQNVLLTEHFLLEENYTQTTEKWSTLDDSVPFSEETKYIMRTDTVFFNATSNFSSNDSEIKMYELATEQYITTKENEEDKEEDVLHEPFFWHNGKSPVEIRSIQGKIMNKYMNRKIEPCNDFYEFACGNWKKYFSIPPDRSSYDTFEMVRENLDFVLRKLLDDIKEIPMNSTYHIRNNFINKNFRLHDTSDSTIKAKNFYKSCMQEHIIKKRNDKPLRRILRQLGGWPVISRNWTYPDFDVIWLLATLRLLNNDVLIAQWVGPDMKNSNEYIVHIDQPTLGLPSREYFLNNSNIKYVRAYKVFILTVGRIMGAWPEIAERDTEDIIQFEVQLAEIMASVEERRNISDIYLRTDIASLTLYFPQFDWKKYFDIVLGTDINLKTPVACYCARYLHELLYLLSNTEPRTLQNYLIWRFVRHRTNSLDQRFMEAKQKFYFVLFGREKQPPRWQFCITQVNSNMGMALGSLFVKKYFDQSSKTDTIEMTKELQEAFKSTLSENSWLDDHTKDYARMKLDYMDLKIGYPDFILNKTELDMRYYDVQTHPDYFFENVLIILRHLTKVEQKRMGSVVNRTMWSTPPAVVNAYYSRNKNQIMFPAGMLQPPFYNRHFPKALNFGGIGVVIGHEITHGFDDKGRLFDHEGNLHLWWRDSSIEKFYEKSQCMIEQYDQYIVPEIRIALDGYLTQGENIADNGGLKQAYRAYEMWLSKHPNVNETLPGVNLTGRQLFFLNFAQVWCGQQRIEAAKNRIKTSVHSPGIFRVLGALSNSEEFSKAYSCPKNSPMNPDFKCIIW